jgi:hypothetical protein
MNVYTISDCFKLKDILKSIGMVDDSLTFYDKVIAKARKKISGVGLDSSDINWYLRDWLIMNYE